MFNHSHSKYNRSIIDSGELPTPIFCGVIIIRVVRKEGKYHKPYIYIYEDPNLDSLICRKLGAFDRMLEVGPLHILSLC